MPTINIAPGLALIDLNFQGEPGVISAYLLEGAGELALIETGPTSTLATLLAALEASGHDLAQLTTIAVTHIHLDHAGAAGHLLAHAPNATLFVHTIGAPHLIDPTRLLRSARRIYGEQMDTLWGEVMSVPSERIHIIDEGDVVYAAGRQLAVLYAPGHASHHVVFHDVEQRMVFTGDAAGVRLTDARYVRPPTPPPDVDLEVWSQTIDRLLALNPRTLLLTHFGPHSGDVPRHLEELRQRLFAWTELVRTALTAGQDPPTIVDSLRREGDAELLATDGDPVLLGRYDLATPYGMTVDGLVRYLQKASSRIR
jgi:glyoxylase-like metal-dependent hydrolase (beta-lactamase superfamily II)